MEDAQMQQLKNRVHTLANQLQVVLGFIELEDLPKALGGIREAILGLHDFSVMLAREITIVPVKDDQKAVISTGVEHIETKDIEKVEVPLVGEVVLPNKTVSVVPKKYIKKKKRKKKQT